MVSEAILHNSKPEELYAVERNFMTMLKGLSNYWFDVPVVEEESEDPEEELLPVEDRLIVMQHTMSAAERESIKKMYDDNEAAPEDIEGEDKEARGAFEQEWGHTGACKMHGIGRRSKGAWIGFQRHHKKR